MEFLFYEVKHAHLSCLRFLRPEAARHGLTPARVDLLRVIQRQLFRRLPQSELWPILGVSKTVVSIMVRALERLGFLRRTRSVADGRTFILTLTRKAKAALRALYYEAVHVGFVRMAVEYALTRSRPGRPEAALSKWELSTSVRLLRRAFGRADPNQNPWFIDDGDEDFWYANVVGNQNLADCAGEGHLGDNPAPVDASEEEEEAAYFNDNCFIPLGPPAVETDDVLEHEIAAELSKLAGHESSSRRRSFGWMRTS